MTPSIYTFTCYRAYLVSRFANARSGHKTTAAEALGVHTSLLPQVLKGSCELTLEQAEKFNNFWDHDPDEASFFLLLVLKSRAGTPALKQRFQSQITEMLEKRTQVSARIARDKTISEKDQEQFYSSYLYGAIHVLASIPKFASAERIAQILGRPEAEIQRAIKFMTSIGVLEPNGKNFKPGSRHVHLPASSALIVNHHLNWRFKALEKIRSSPRKDLHYSAAISLSEADVTKIKEVLLDALARTTDIAVKSKEETAYVLCMDFFGLL